MTVVYEDNHIIVVSKTASEIVQGDKTGDTPLSEMVQQYLKEKYNKPGNVFIGVTHRLDRPVSGLVVKNGAGFYDYSDGKDEAVIKRRDDIFLKLAKCLFEE